MILYLFINMHKYAAWVKNLQANIATKHGQWPTSTSPLWVRGYHPDPQEIVTSAGFTIIFVA